MGESIVRFCQSCGRITAWTAGPSGYVCQCGVVEVSPPEVDLRFCPNCQRDVMAVATDTGLRCLICGADA
jgi:hypothetical protein